MVDQAIRVVVREDFASISLAARNEAALTRAVQAEFSVALPPPGKFVIAADVIFVCTTPGQWLVLRDHDDATLFDRLAAAAGEHGLLIDVTCSRVAVRVSGPGLRDRLSTLLPIDLHPRAMRPGDAAATIAAHLAVLVCQVDDAPTYDLFCASSFAGSFRRALELAGLPNVSGFTTA